MQQTGISSILSSRSPSTRSQRDAPTTSVIDRYDSNKNTFGRSSLAQSEDGSAYKELPRSIPSTLAGTGVVGGSIGGGQTAVEASSAIRSPAVNVADEDEGEERKTIPITWALVVMASYVTSGGVLFANWEGWSLLDGCYFCYISLSTIGFGDLVPGRIVSGEDGDQVQVDSKQIICTIYLLVGMALVAMCFNLMQEEAIENLKTFWRSLGCLRKHVKRGRDKIRGKRRKSGIKRSEHDAIEIRNYYTRDNDQWLQGRRSIYSARIEQEDMRSYQDATDDQYSKSNKRSSIIQKVPKSRNVETIIVSNYDNERNAEGKHDSFDEMNELKHIVHERNRENIEMKYFKNRGDLKWHRSSLTSGNK